MKQWKAQKMIARDGFKIINEVGGIENNVIALNIVNQNDAELIASAPETLSKLKEYRHELERLQEIVEQEDYDSIEKILANNKAEEKS